MGRSQRSTVFLRRRLQSIPHIIVGVLKAFFNLFDLGELASVQVVELGSDGLNFVNTVGDSFPVNP